VATLFILGDVLLHREGLEQQLARTPSVSVLGHAAYSAETLDRLRRLRPQVLLLDLGLEESLRVAPTVRAVLPDTRLIVLAVPSTGQDVIACAEAGVTGYVTRDAAIGELVATIERAARGETFCPPAITASLFERIAVLASARQPQPAGSAQLLTSREVEIVRLIDQGLSNKEIARALSIAVPTVKNHVHNVLQKLNVERRRDAACYLGGRVEARTWPLPLESGRREAGAGRPSR
jgi:two-component system, NarL family, nitrate/nitrite response regulator NarL